MFGIKSAPLPGVAAAQIICDGFGRLSPDEKELVAELLVRLAPGLAAQGEHAKALPMSKILSTLREAFGEAWRGILKPKKLLADLVGALEQAPEGAELRGFCAAVAERCRAANAAPAEPAQIEAAE